MGLASPSGPLLKVFAGPMFSGKTTRLLKTMQILEPQYPTRVLAKWSQDLRAGSQNIVSTHSGLSRTANVHAAFTSLDDVKLDSSNTLIAVDEGQFFGEDLLRLWNRISQQPESSNALLVAGLDLDFLKKPFGVMPLLIDLAGPGNVEILTARCHVCQAPAPFTSRIIQSDHQILVGGAESYQPTCAEHYSCASPLPSQFDSEEMVDRELRVSQRN
eukprot:CAMPEP_0171509814 /NCGR_PEP_ID=MMETSP0959-20130129/14_1 /TAXON_ID=87120 /ORGANISM="Aurantiochytrium limacinum, Strain ATCCMYA-1381" /LENGTH=215 /DNA_ID=CAMNT_0012047103 /DNA_START=95 /DNA_END=742 /DNA_ORIENTATION=+